MGKHHQPVLIRAYLRGYETPLPSAFVYTWRESEGYAEFYLPRDHDLAKVITESWRDITFVVASATTPEWLPERWTCGWNSLRISLISRELSAKNAMMPDDFMIELWLEAEKRYKEAA